ncbi:hypothetical protein IE81DRAFT_322674 [Ceraceosorus guamensis]|uniref:Uncharacterized protein n=1 Tax=Ceraceosorus guamensis TaxID=1522189 RepID=A0A316W320_9BASI|nr:hypothetical protein IE81DRAFT_322674 [Ceraceosorus guamensis]PWN43163.1 hypothetical protein IE81DRAFT_322674 [Ceraceosorus guamensis]
MVRGAAKAQAQAKNQAKANSSKEAKSQLDSRGAALKFACKVCKAPAPSYKTLLIHYDSKHPKETCPSEASFAA